MPKCILTEQGGKGGGGGGLELISIEVTSQPSKKEYLAGDQFDPQGLVVTASYGMNGLVLTTTEIQGYTVTPDPLTDGTTELTVTYSEGGKVCTAKITDIVVIHKLLNITIDTHLGKTTYEYGDTLITDNYVVTASYSDNKTDNVSSKGVTYTPTTLNVVNQSFQITVKYTEHQVEVSTTFNVIVNKKTITNLKVEPDTIQVSSKGGTGQVTFSGDGTASLQESSFIPEIPTITLSKITDGNYTINVTGDGKTAISDDEAKILTINVADSTNYTYNPNHVMVKITAQYWTWGEETEVGDQDWWAGLKSWISTASNEELKACENKKKFVSFSDGQVAGWNKVPMMCIGAEIDGDKTLTFQTQYCSPTQAAFSASNAEWETSNAKKTCDDFADKCSASQSLKEISIKYRKVYSSSRGQKSDETYTCKCFLPSECQMGLNNYSIADDEWTVDGKEIAYPVYTDNPSRVKHYSTADGADSNSTGWYWERSRNYNNSYYVCGVGSGGSVYYNNYTNSYGRLAPAFVIG